MLTKRQREVLTIMRDKAGSEAGEIVYEKGEGYLGNRRISSKTIFSLIRLTALRACGDQNGGLERYRIGQTGIELLKKGPR